MEKCSSADGYLGLSEVFDSISGVLDAEEQSRTCYDKAKSIDTQNAISTQIAAARQKQAAKELKDKQIRKKLKRKAFIQKYKVPIFGMALICVLAVIAGIKYLNNYYSIIEAERERLSTLENQISECRTFSRLYYEDGILSAFSNTTVDLEDGKYSYSAKTRGGPAPAQVKTIEHSGNFSVTMEDGTPYLILEGIGECEIIMTTTGAIRGLVVEGYTDYSGTWGAVNLTLRATW